MRHRNLFAVEKAVTFCHNTVVVIPQATKVSQGRTIISKLHMGQDWADCAVGPLHTAMMLHLPLPILLEYLTLRPLLCTSSRYLLAATVGTRPRSNFTPALPALPLELPASGLSRASPNMAVTARVRLRSKPSYTAEAICLASWTLCQHHCFALSSSLCTLQVHPSLDATHSILSGISRIRSIAKSKLTCSRTAHYHQM